MEEIYHMKKNIKINELLGIKYPIIQGGMANIATGEFAAAVSNAGGLGLVGAGGMNVGALKEHIQVCKSLTSKPFGVNIMLMNPEAPAMAQLVIDEKIPVVTTGAGNPSKFIAMWKEAGILVFPVVPNVALAKKMEQLGADGVIAEGCESGGHIGDLSTMAMVPQIINAVNIPVIAAGGIASGKQLLAAYALGASGVQIGTCLLVAEECPIHENYKNAILKARDSSTTVTGRIAGVPVRIIKNQMTTEYIKLEKAGVEILELEKFTLGGLRKAVFDGDIQNGSLMAGQVAGQLTKIRPIKEILEELVVDCKIELEKLAGEIL